MSVQGCVYYVRLKLLNYRVDRSDSHTRRSDQRTKDMLKFFNTYARKAPGDIGLSSEARHIDLECLTRLVADMFPSDNFTDEQIQEGFMLIDTEGRGRISFDVFCDWWQNMKVSDALGLHQEWRKTLLNEEQQGVKELQHRADRWHRKNT
jgi:Ca2+-binding EF-hand superfamily protein